MIVNLQSNSKVARGGPRVCPDSTWKLEYQISLMGVGWALLPKHIFDSRQGRYFMKYSCEWAEPSVRDLDYRVKRRCLRYFM